MSVTVCVDGYRGGLGLVVPNLERELAAEVVARMVRFGRAVEVRYDEEDR